MPLSSADRNFLSQEWRYVEVNNPAILAAHPSAREADRPSQFIDAAAALAVVTAVTALLGRDGVPFAVTIQGIVDIDLSGMTPTWTLYCGRLGLQAGRNMIVERVDTDWARERTTLYLWG